MGDYNKTNWQNNTSPAISAENLNKIENTLDALWPAIGDIEINISGINPSSRYTGTTWVEVGQGQCLMGAKSGQTGGQSVSAGLPNITGTWSARWNRLMSGFIMDNETYVSGAFYRYYPAGSVGRITGEDVNGGNSAAYAFPGLDASRSNPIYGASDTVQPPSLIVHFWQRTA